MVFEKLLMSDELFAFKWSTGIYHTNGLKKSHVIQGNVKKTASSTIFQGCQTWDFVPRSWEFLKVMGFSLEFIFFEENQWINLGNFRNCSAVFFLFVRSAYSV